MQNTVYVSVSSTQSYHRNKAGTHIISEIFAGLYVYICPDLNYNLLEKEMLFKLSVFQKKNRKPLYAIGIIL
jgi:hypothetical protein